jgi:thioredoxin-dependent peroxiredoxin
MQLQVGDKAPEFSLFDQSNRLHKLSDYAGKRLLIYFYPADDTPGCTTEACNFRDNLSLLAEKLEILGVSSDSLDSHVKFSSKYRLNFPILSDPDKTTINNYGANGLIFTKRSSFLISPDGIIEKIYTKVDPEKHASQVLEDIK